MNIRLGDNSDIDAVNAFLMSQVPYQRDFDFWYWIHRVWHSQSVFAVAEEHGKIVGLYAAGLKSLFVFGRIHSVALGFHAVVDRQYRDQVSIFEISDLVYKKLKALGITAIFGFPNINYREVQVKLERWSSIGLFKALELDISSFVGTKESSLVEVNDPKQLLQWEPKAPIGGIAFARHSEFYSRRFFRHPQNEYKVFGVMYKGMPGALVTVKIFRSDGGLVGHLVDYHPLQADMELSNCLGLISTYFRDKGVNKLVFWPMHSKYAAEMLEYGFSDTGFETMFAVKFLNKQLIDDATREAILRFENWFLHMADSDVF